MSILPTVLILLLLLGGIIALQIFLSSKSRRWPGLILPGLSLFNSLLISFSLVSYNALFSGTVHLSAALGSCVIPFLLMNIPTLILVAIFFACRENCKKKREFEKMSVQDLE
ncbi:MAG: hypothetical protein H6Q60_557 [Oscillospiraceae bacterium]|nr:hypothetical protein [Oscillospiraceae bacterium]